MPAPEGASLTTLPAQRVLVTVSGTTYYLYSNTFYRRVVSRRPGELRRRDGAGRGRVHLRPAARTSRSSQLNTMYFATQGQYYVPFLSSDGQERYVLVDRPPQPPATAVGPGAAVARAARLPPAAPRRPARGARSPSRSSCPRRPCSSCAWRATSTSASAKAGDRFQGFLDADLSAGGRFIAPRGARVYGVVASADPGNKTRGKPALSVTLTELQVGERAVPIQTRPISVEGKALHGGKKVKQAASLGSKIGEAADPWDGASTGAKAGAAVGLAAVAKSSPDAAVLPAQSQQVFTVAAPFQLDVMTSVAVR